MLSSLFSSAKKVKKLVQDNQPISVTGVIPHTYYWVTTLNSNDIVYHNPNFKELDRDDPDLKKGVAIYCAHGTADQPGSFAKIARRLIKKGLPDYISSIHLVSFEERYHGKGIECFSEELCQKVKTNGHKHVIYMGHSRGGLIASHAAENADKNVHVHQVFPICAPFKGSDWAMKPLTYFSTSVGQMQNHANFLEGLCKAIGESNLEYHFFGAEEDKLVSPASSHVTDYVKKRPDSKLILKRHGHLSVMSSHKLVDHIYAQLVMLGQRLKKKATQDESAPLSKEQHQKNEEIVDESLIPTL